MAVEEGQVDTGAAGEGISYSGVTSCLTVTCLIEDGGYVGGHLSLIKKNINSAEVLPAMKQLIAGRGVAKVHLQGQLDMWNPQYFVIPLTSDTGESNYPDAGSAGHHRVVQRGVHRQAVAA